MLKSILIGLDGSPTCEAAVDLGIQWAKRFDALLIGLAVVVEPLRHMREPADACADESGREPASDSETKACRTTERDLGPLCGPLYRSGRERAIYIKTREYPTRKSCVNRSATIWCCSVMKPISVLQPWIRPDETLRDVLKRESRPVVIAPRKLEPGSSVVVAYNGSPQADRALQAFQSSGLDLGEEVCVLSADDDREEASRQAERAVEFLRLHRIKAIAHAIGPVDSVRQSILDEVAAPQCPLARHGSVWAFDGA